MEYKKLRVIVCGTTFGQFYCEAFALLKNQFEFVGILSNGSERSRKCAEQYNVRLFHSVEELDDKIDLACVVVRSAVMGGKGSDIAVDLLNRGIHVIQEQPVHYREIELCIKVAMKNNVRYCIADLYKNLPAISRFIKACKAIFEKDNPIYIDAGGASQVLFPLIEILSESLENIKPFCVKNVDRTSGPFHILTANIRDIPAIFQIHNEVNPNEPDNFMHYLHRITIGTNSGRICLEDTQGPVCWYNKLHFPLNVDVKKCFDGEWPNDLRRLNRIEFIQCKENMFGEIFKTDWLQAISEELVLFKKMILEPSGKVNVYYTKLISNAKIWHEFTKYLGFPEEIELGENTYIDINEIKERIEKSNMFIERRKDG